MKGTFAMKRLEMMLLAAALVAGISGCEFTNSPLLVEGAFVNSAFRVDQEGLPPNTPFGIAATVRLSDVLKDVNNIADSIKIYNISVMIDSVTGTTSASTPISGTASIDGHALFSMANVPLSSLHNEQSIFDPSVAGFTFNSTGVQYLVQSLRQKPPPNVTVAVLGNSSASTFHFTLHVKIYTQIYTTP